MSVPRGSTYCICLSTIGFYGNVNIHITATLHLLKCYQVNLRKQKLLQLFWSHSTLHLGGPWLTWGSSLWGVSPFPIKTRKAHAPTYICLGVYFVSGDYSGEICAVAKALRFRACLHGGGGPHPPLHSISHYYGQPTHHVNVIKLKWEID